LQSQYSPLNGASVPFCRQMRYCSALNWERHSESGLVIFCMAMVWAAVGFIVTQAGGNVV